MTKTGFFIAMVFISVVILDYLKRNTSIFSFKSIFSKSKYEVEDVHVIIDDSIINGCDPYAVIEPVWYSVIIYQGETDYEQSLEPFSLCQRYVSAIYLYLGEVDNGGHDQFYFNYTGIVWEDAMRGFQEIALPDFSDIILESAKRLGGSPSKDRFERQKQLDRMEPDFSDLDTTVYQMEAIINPALLAYVKKNRTDFYFDGIVKIPKQRKK